MPHDAETGSNGPLRLLLTICAIPVWIVMILVAAVAVPGYLLYRALVRSICPRCKLPFARQVLSARFDRENVKFNADHYKVACQCRWCRHRWEHEKLVSVTPASNDAGLAGDE